MESCFREAVWRFRKAKGLRLRLFSLQYSSASVPGAPAPSAQERRGGAVYASRGQNRFKLRSSGFMVFFAAAPSLLSCATQRPGCDFSHWVGVRGARRLLSRSSLPCRTPRRGSLLTPRPSCPPVDATPPPAGENDTGTISRRLRRRRNWRGSRPAASTTTRGRGAIGPKKRRAPSPSLRSLGTPARGCTRGAPKPSPSRSKTPARQPARRAGGSAQRRRGICTGRQRAQRRAEQARVTTYCYIFSP